MVERHENRSTAQLEISFALVAMNHDTTVNGLAPFVDIDHPDSAIKKDWPIWGFQSYILACSGRSWTAPTDGLARNLALGDGRLRVWGTIFEECLISSHIGLTLRDEGNMPYLAKGHSGG